MYCAMKLMLQVPRASMGKGPRYLDVPRLLMVAQKYFPSGDVGDGDTECRSAVTGLPLAGQSACVLAPGLVYSMIWQLLASVGPLLPLVPRKPRKHKQNQDKPRGGNETFPRH